MAKIELSKSEQKEAKQFRIEKCGVDNYQQFKLAFGEYLKKQQEKEK